MFAVQKFLKPWRLWKYEFDVQNTKAHRNWPFLHMRAGLEITQNTNTKYLVLYKSRAVQIVDSRERTRQSGRRLATTVCSPMNYWRQNGFRRPLYFWIFSNHISSLFNIWIFFHHISSILDSLATAWKENDPSKDDGGASLGRGGGQRWQMEAEVGEPWETNTGDQQAGQVGQTFVFPSSGEVYFSAPMKSICLEGKRSECGGWRNTISTSATKVPSAQTQISCNTRTLNHMDRGIVLNGKRLPRNGQILSLSKLIF